MYWLLKEREWHLSTKESYYFVYNSVLGVFLFVSFIKFIPHPIPEGLWSCLQKC